MKKNNKKGFTIVELVIVIAVIAILAAVMIPTFSNVVSKANASAALSAAKNTYTEALVDQTDGALNDGTMIYVEQGSKVYAFKVSGGTIAEETTNVPSSIPSEAGSVQTGSSFKKYSDTNGTIVISGTDVTDLTSDAGYTAGTKTES